jgi:hypothetical protein
VDPFFFVPFKIIVAGLVGFEGFGHNMLGAFCLHTHTHTHKHTLPLSLNTGMDHALFAPFYPYP